MKHVKIYEDAKSRWSRVPYNVVTTLVEFLESRDKRLKISNIDIFAEDIIFSTVVINNNNYELFNQLFKELSEFGVRWMVIDTRIQIFSSGFNKEKFDLAVSMKKYNL
jgi:hypothetical protein